jgi:hypothetical protein
MTIIQPRPQGVSSADHLIRIIGEFIVQQDNKLMARIKALEERLDNFRDCGVWKEGEIYFDMNMVSHNGSFWLCKCRTQNKPGTDPVSWRLVAKHGRDGRDADGERSPRRPSHRSHQPP